MILPIKFTSSDMSFKMTMTKNSTLSAPFETGHVSALTDYETLTRKPKINGIDIVGNKSGKELGLLNTTDKPTILSNMDIWDILST